MDTPTQEWFVDEFHLRSPVEEFEEFSSREVERLRSEDPSFADARHRAAIDLVRTKLHTEREGTIR